MIKYYAFNVKYKLQSHQNYPTIRSEPKSFNLFHNYFFHTSSMSLYVDYERRKWIIRMTNLYVPAYVMKNQCD